MRNGNWAALAVALATAGVCWPTVARAESGYGAGLEVSTLKFLSGSAGGPVFGPRLFGSYYIDHRLAMTGGFSWFFPATHSSDDVGYSASDPQQQGLIPINVKVGVKMFDLEGRYFFVGDPFDKEQKLGLYGALGASLLFISEQRSLVQSGDRFAVDSNDPGTGGFAIHGGLGLQYKLDPLVLGAGATFAVPANRVNDQPVPIEFSAFATLRAGVEYRFK